VLPTVYLQGWPEPYIYCVLCIVYIRYIYCVLCIYGIYGINIVYCVYTVFLAGKSPNIRSHTVYIYSSGQTYVYVLHSSGEVYSFAGHWFSFQGS